MKKIRVNFTGLSIRSEFDPYNNPILDILRKHYDVEICENPDYVFCGMLYPGGYYSHGMFDNYILDYPCIRIMIEGENYVPDYNLIDYSICPYPINYYDRNFYFPCGVEALTSGVSYLPKVYRKNRNYPKEFLASKQIFAAFVESHDSEYNERSAFFQALNQRKRVDSAGSFLNNMPNGQRVNWLDGTKIELLKNSKFSICIEPLKHDGWIAERIVEAFFADTIPIYHGSSNIKDIFNPKAFIDLSDYPNFEEAIERILEIESDDDKYLEMLRQPIFNDPEFPKKLMCDLEEYLCHIIDQPLDKAYRRSRIYSPKLHEDFIRRSTKRGYLYDVEGIEFMPKVSLKKQLKNYFLRCLKRLLRKIRK